MTLVVIGSGGHAKVVVATAIAMGRTDIRVFDDDPARIGKAMLGIVVEGPLSSLSVEAEAIVAIGDNRARAKVAAEIELPFATLVHPFSFVDKDAVVGPGSVVFAGAVVQPGARIGDHCILNTGCSVDHDCVLADFVQVGPGATLAGAVRIGEGSTIGIGASVIQDLEVGAWSTVGAGAAVVRDVPGGVVVKGVPAR